MSHQLRERIIRNKKLGKLENQGFERGDSRGKTMDVQKQVVMASLYKQVEDVAQAWNRYFFRVQATRPYPHNLPLKEKEELERCLADLRNVAGCLFLKLEEGST